MKNFETILLNRKADIIFNHPKFVSAVFKGQSTSASCQGNWKNVIISIEKENYTFEKLKSKVESEYNVSFY